MLKTEKKYVVMITETFWNNYEDILDVIDTPKERETRTMHFNTLEESLKWIREDICDYYYDNNVEIIGIENMNEEAMVFGVNHRYVSRVCYDAPAYDRMFVERLYSVFTSEKRVALGGQDFNKMFDKSIGRR